MALSEYIGGMREPVEPELKLVDPVDESPTMIDPDEELGNSLAMAKIGNPAQASQAMGIAKRLEVSGSIVESDIDGWSKIDNDRRAEADIRSSDLMRKAFSNPEFAKIAFDDVHELTTVEKSLQYIYGAGERSTIGMQNIGRSLLSTWVDFSLKERELTGEEKRTGVVRNDMITRTMQKIGAWAKEGHKAGEKRVQELTPQDIHWLAEGVDAGIVSAPQMLAAYIMGGGSPAVVMWVMGIGQGTEAFVKGREEGLSKTDAAMYGATQGMAEAIGEYPAAKLLVGILESVGEKAAKKMIVKLIAAEGGGEFVTQVMQDISSLGYGVDKELREAKTTEELLLIMAKRARVAFVAGVTMGGIMGGAPVIAETTSDIADLRARRSLSSLDPKARDIILDGMVAGESMESISKKLKDYDIDLPAIIPKVRRLIGRDEKLDEARAQATVNYFKKIGEAVKSSKVYQRDKAKMEEFITHALADNPDATVDIDIDGAVTYFQQIGIDPVEGLAEFGLYPEEANIAVNTGNDITLPVARFAANAGSEHYDGMVRNVRMEKGAPTMTEVAENQETEAAKSDGQIAKDNAKKVERAKKILDKRKNEKAFTESAAAVHGYIRQQAIDAGRSEKEAENVALIFKAFSVTLADSQGMMPMDVLGIREPEIQQGGEGGDYFSTSAIKSVEANIRRGRKALGEAVANKTSVHRAMFRTGMGWVDFVWGDTGTVKPSGKTKGAMGLSHIIEARQRKDGKTEEESLKLLDDVVETIAKGREIGRDEVEGYTKLRLQHGNKYAVLVRRKGSNSWLLTGFEEKPGGAGTANEFPAPTQSTATPGRGRLGADKNTLEQSLPSVNQAQMLDEIHAANQLGANPMLFGAQGSITFEPDRAIINLFESANKSTLLHEVSHYFLQVYSDLSESGQASNPVQREIDTLLNWFGIDSVDQIETSHHEMFARSFERYLAEGKAPSAELQNVFDRFASWLLEIYKSLKAINAPINDDIRAVMDQMLAGEAGRKYGMKMRGKKQEKIAERAVNPETRVAPPPVPPPPVAGLPPPPGDGMSDGGATIMAKETNPVVRWFRRNFFKEGLLGSEGHESMLASDAIKNVGEIENATLIHDFKKSVKEAYGVAYKNLSAAEIENLNDYISGIEWIVIPDNLRPHADALRSHLDRYSREMIKGLMELHQLKVDKLSDRQRAGYDLFLETEGLEGKMPEHLVSSLEMMNTIQGNIGTYLTRSYQAFDDPKWKSAVLNDAGIINDAKEFIAENNPDLLPEEVMGAVYAILQSAQEDGNFASFISKGAKVGSKDVSILNKRKNVPDEIRALLGEYKDPVVNFSRSASKMQWWVANHTFLMDFRGKGLGLFLRETPVIDGGNAYDSRIATEGSDTMNPLDGLYTTADIKQGMEDALNKWDGSELMRTLIGLNSMVKYGKTILSPTTQFRNFMSATMFSIMNGYFNYGHAVKAFRVAKADIFTHEARWQEYIKEMVALGVVHDNPYAQELKDAINDFTDENTFKTGYFRDNGKFFLNFMQKMYQVGDDFLNFMQKMYQVGDDFHKIIGYENELGMQLRVGIPLGQAKKNAAYKIRNGFPTYSQVPRGIKKIRRWPLIGTFVSFPWESGRTAINQVKFIKEDLQAGHMEMASRRIIGMAIASSAAYAASKMSMIMLGMDDDDDEAVRAMLPEWSANSQLFYLGYDKDGLPTYVDLTYLDPYEVLKKPITALMNGNYTRWEEKAVASMTEILQPFIGVDIAAGSIGQVLYNKNSYGGNVYNPDDEPWDKAKTISNHFRKALQPGAFNNIERTIKALEGYTEPSGKVYTVKDESLAWIGFRTGTMNPYRSMIYKGYEFSDTIRNASTMFSRVAGSQSDVSEAEIKKAFDKMNRVRDKAFNRMFRSVHQARKLGMSERDVIDALTDGKAIGKENANAIVAWRVKKWKMSSQFLKSRTGRAKTSERNKGKRKEIQKMMDARKKYIRKLIQENKK